MTRTNKIVPHGSGPTTARGRVALWAALEPFLAEACVSLGIGRPRAVRRIDRGTHHLVWRVRTNSGTFALRPSALTGRNSFQKYASRESLWASVGQWGVAPSYVGSVPLRIRTFDGRIEAFEWIPGRSLRPRQDAGAIGQTLAILHSQRVSLRQLPLEVTAIAPFLQTQLRHYQRLNHVGGEIEYILAQESRRALDVLRHFKPGKTRSVLVHNDLVDANVLYSDGRIWLIDWDWALLTHPCVDLYCFLSPLVRSWGSRPRFLNHQTTTAFLTSYFTSRSRRSKSLGLGHELNLWQPYNALVANWLYRDALRLPHLGRASFYSSCFRNVARLTEVIAAFK